MSEKTKPSPLPWKVVRERDRAGWKGISIMSADGLSVANMVMQPGTDNEYTNAQLIVRAANSFRAAIKKGGPC